MVREGGSMSGGDSAQWRRLCEEHSREGMHEKWANSNFRIQNCRRREGAQNLESSVNKKVRKGRESGDSGLSLHRKC
jgi:hypothetical protein